MGENNQDGVQCAKLDLFLTPKGGKCGGGDAHPARLSLGEGGPVVGYPAGCARRPPAPGAHGLWTVQGEAL